MSRTANFDRPHLGADAAGSAMSADEFHAVTDYDEAFIYELIHGAVVVSSFPPAADRAASERLGYRLREFQESHENGSSLIETVYFHYLSVRGNERLAHRVVWTRRESGESDPRRSFPTIVVDFLSVERETWRDDDLERRDDYFATGALEYWLFDRLLRTLTVYSQLEGACVETVVNEGQAYSTNLLPGFELQIADLLSAADAWAGHE